MQFLVHCDPGVVVTVLACPRFGSTEVLLFVHTSMYHSASLCIIYTPVFFCFQVIDATDEQLLALY